jgi:hypothetical protein
MGSRASTSRPSTAVSPGEDGSFASLPEQLALDLSVAFVEQWHAGRWLLLANSPSAVTEALARLTSPVTVVTPTRRLARMTEQIVASGIHPDPRSVNVSTTDEFPGRTNSPIDKVLWLQPSEETLETGIAMISGSVDQRAVIAVVGVGPLHRWRLTMQRDRHIRESRPCDPFVVTAKLGCESEQEWRLLGLRSAALTPFRIAAARIGRWDLVDRLEAAYRLRLIEARTPRLWAVGVSIGRRPTMTRS